MDVKVGDLIRAKEGTLAHFNSDISGVVEKIDGPVIYARMDHSRRLVPFSRKHIDVLERRPNG